MRNLAAALLFVALGTLTAPARAVSLWDENSRSMVSDSKARFVGDIVTVIVNEITNANQRMTTETEQDNEQEVKVGVGLLRDIFEPTKMETTDAYEFEGRHRDQGSLTTRLSAVITEVLPNGNLLIEAKRTVVVGPEMRMLTLSGIVRKEDISQTNTILSNQIANAVIRYDGEGPQAKRAKPGIVSRLFNLIF